ncbi:hypothetical protein C8F04DRAFT_1258425 [Mycena alexandri]|uniref:Uncharacterized protein n=1 Tax=Mycena alexandri TaxID=1745969 RepID=A0AAD6X464_9AGAR|nr:hypothetical protein C8F04DRAFT_1258425 [Mycena alexandri]
MKDNKPGCSQAQLEALARYRTKNKPELQRKARERMARRRAKLRASPELDAQYKATAREDSARYRAAHGAALAVKQRERRSKRSIAKIGYDKWLEGFKRRCPTPPSESETPLSSSAEPSTPPAPPPGPPTVLDLDDDKEAHRVKRLAACVTYEDEVNYWLDYCDPTIAPDYIPKPGQTPFWQRGCRRWE